MSDKRFIEVSFPIKEVSKESAREKGIGHGHISALHTWWARRPLTASRATNYAALIPAPKNQVDWDKTRQFIVDLSKWKNTLNNVLIEKARENVRNANNGVPPRVLDPFAGGGSIPLEALRLGCETYAGEYNPVAVLILKCVLEYPQKYRNPRRQGNWGPLKGCAENQLINDIEKWGEWVWNEVAREIKPFYPEYEDGTIPIGFIWARTIPCQNPSCSAEIPLIRQYWLANRSTLKVALKPLIKDGDLMFEVIHNPEFDPSKGTVRKAIVKCPICGSTIDGKTVRSLFQKGKAGERMIAVIAYHPEKRGKYYRVVTDKDIETFKKAKEYLAKKRARLMDEWGLDPVPDEPLPPKGTLGFRIQNYGFSRWGDLFNDRQKLVLITFVEKVRKAYTEMLRDGYDAEYAKVITTYLALGVSKLAESCNTNCRWEPGWEKLIPALSGRREFPMVWDYFELNPISGASRSWLPIIETIINSLKVTANIEKPAIVFYGSATELPFQDEFFDAVFTDPPYYDNIPYSYLSDFFYVWLKRTIGDLYPELFLTPLTPKSKEIVAYTHDKTKDEAIKFFEENLKKAFKEIYRVLKTGGIATIVYTHKSTAGWEALINSLLDSGLVVTASWPIHTERRTRLRAMESAALASSIYFVVRKVKREKIGWFSQVKREIKERIYERLDRLWQEGISGADYFISAIGSAIEVFGRYEKVMDYEGNVIRGERLLNFIRDVVADYVLRQILHEAVAARLSPLTKFYILWRWTYGEAKVHFDDARKLAQSVGIDLEQEWNKGFIKKEKEFVRVLGPEERNPKELERSNELIDVLHRVLLLWKKGDKEGMKEVLIETGFGEKDIFYKVAQALAGILPKDSKEKRLLDGFLAGKERLISDLKARKRWVQRRLVE